MRCTMRRGHPNGFSRGLLAAVATSGIAFSVQAAETGSLKTVNLWISNCEDWRYTGKSGKVRLQIELLSEKTSGQLDQILKRFVGGEWVLQRRQCSVQDFVDTHANEHHTQRLSNFLNLSRVETFIGALTSHLELTDPQLVMRLSVDLYPLRSLLQHKGHPFKAWIERLLQEDHKARRWIKHLRAAGLSEVEIANFGAELILKTSQYYHPCRSGSLQEAIKKAVKHLAQPGSRAGVIHAYRRESKIPQSRSLQ